VTSAIVVWTRRRGARSVDQALRAVTGAAIAWVDVLHSELNAWRARTSVHGQRPYACHYSGLKSVIYLQHRRAGLRHRQLAVDRLRHPTQRLLVEPHHVDPLRHGGREMPPRVIALSARLRIRGTDHACKKSFQREPANRHAGRDTPRRRRLRLRPADLVSPCLISHWRQIGGYPCGEADWSVAGWIPVSRWWHLPTPFVGTRLWTTSSYQIEGFGLHAIRH
jgi:hypothetical protein